MIFQSIKLSLFTLKSKLIFAALFIFFTALYVFVPIYTTPSHSLSFFIEITSYWRWLLIFAFSAALSLLVSLQIYLWTNVKQFERKSKASIFSALGAFATSLFSCIACGATLFALILPVGFSYYLNTHMEYVLIIGALMALYGIYTSSKAISGHCERCAA